jgi:hypothetical protein
MSRHDWASSPPPSNPLDRTFPLVTQGEVRNSRDVDLFMIDSVCLGLGPVSGWPAGAGSVIPSPGLTPAECLT